MTTRRWATIAVTVALLTMVIVFLAWPEAGADYRGSDPFRDLTGGEADGLMGKYPLSAYKLDTNINSSTLPGPSWIEEAAALGANVIWWVTALFVKLAISFVALAFDLELLDEDGAMQPISQATRRLHSTLSEPAMAFMIVLLALWVAKKGIWDRRHGEATGALLTSAAFMIIALIMILRPMETVGRLADITNTAAQGILVGVNGGSLADPDQTRTKIADELWRTHGYYPWVVLNFGGLRHCVDMDDRDSDGFPTSVAANDPKRDVCRDHVRVVDGAGGYAPRFLAHPYGSDERKLEFEALRDGEMPQADPSCNRALCDADQETRDQFAGYYVDKADAPAVDIQQKGGGYDRLGLAFGIALASAPMIVLYAGVAISIILFQLFALLLFAFTPIALMAAAIPGRGHDYFKAWGLMLIGLLALEGLFAVVLIVLVTVSTAFTSAVDVQGWVFAYALLAALYLVVIWKRNALPQMVASRRSVKETERTVRSTAERTVHAGVVAVTHPVKAIRQSAKERESSREREEGKQERASRDVQPAVVPVATASENGRDSEHVKTAGKEAEGERGASPGKPVFVADAADANGRDLEHVETAKSAATASGPRSEERGPDEKRGATSRTADNASEVTGVSAGEGPARHGQQEPARQEAAQTDESVRPPSVTGLPPQAKEPPPVERPAMPQDVEPPEPPMIDREDVRVRTEVSDGPPYESIERLRQPPPKQDRAPERSDLMPPPEYKDG